MLHTFERGQGAPTTLLLHGFLGTGRNLASLARRLSERAPGRVVAADLLGHGGSPPLGHDATLARLATEVVTSARALTNGTPVQLVGHSLGGRVALAALEQAPDAFSRVVLLDIAPGPLPVLRGPMQRTFERLMGAPARAKSRAEMRQFFLEGEVSASMADWVLTNLAPAADGSVRWRFDRAALASLHWSETDVDLWSVASAHGARIELVYGGASAFVQPEDVTRLRAAGARVHELPGAGHFLHVDALEGLVELLAAR